ncbi:MAG: flagellar biosynthetic protein FliO [Bradymonadaceae bacterium]|nr:flagellar biosynthetic protein FliO [Lujinxingiaceae bacterium]
MARSWIFLFAIVVLALCVPGPALAEELIAAASAPSTGTARAMGYGTLLLRMTLMLTAVCVVAYVSLRWGVKRLIGSHSSEPMVEVLSRTVIEPRRAILIVRVANRHLIVGTTEQGMSALGELSADEAAQVVVAKGLKTNAKSFKTVFKGSKDDENSQRK